jgi:hypothetical protein
VEGSALEAIAPVCATSDISMITAGLTGARSEPIPAGGDLVWILLGANSETPGLNTVNDFVLNMVDKDVLFQNRKFKKKNCFL